MERLVRGGINDFSITQDSELRSIKFKESTYLSECLKVKQVEKNSTMVHKLLLLQVIVLWFIVSVLKLTIATQIK